jgi:hypothetical protein
VKVLIYRKVSNVPRPGSNIPGKETTFRIVAVDDSTTSEGLEGNGLAEQWQNYSEKYKEDSTLGNVAGFGWEWISGLGERMLERLNDPSKRVPNGGENAIGAAFAIAGGASNSLGKGGVTVASGYGSAGPMVVIREIKHGEKVIALINEAKGLTWMTGNEHAVVTLANGKRALVSGGPGGINFQAGSIKNIFGHTHPTNAPPSSADAQALGKLGQSKQYVIHGGQISVVRPK